MNVMVAVIQGDDGRFFVCQRQAHQPFAGYWEFPGGKQEAGEDEYMAMCRELVEELGIQAVDLSPVMSIPYQLPNDKMLRLHIWHLTSWIGDIHGAEGQVCQWVDVETLATLTLPPANAVLVETLLAREVGR